MVAAFADDAALCCTQVVTPTDGTGFGFTSMASTLVVIPPKYSSEDSSISRTATALAYFLVTKQLASSVYQSGVIDTQCL